MTELAETRLVEVRPSPLQGRGLFATRCIAPLTRVAVYGGKRKPPNEVMRTRRPPSERASDGGEGEWEELPTRSVLAKLRYLINTYDDTAVLDPTGMSWASLYRWSPSLTHPAVDE